MSAAIQDLIESIVKFRNARDWQQFHTIKNLMISLNLEASELLELAQWKNDDDIKASIRTEAGAKEVAEECADIFIYLLMICHECQIDLIKATNDKIVKNAEKYPKAKSKGSSKKYTKL